MLGSPARGRLYSLDIARQGVAFICRLGDKNPSGVRHRARAPGDHRHTGQDGRAEEAAGGFQAPP